MQRSALVTIDENALRHNVKRARSIAPQSQVISVVKANAYGHGVEQVVPAIESLSDAFAVACMPEAFALRELTQKPILVLQGCQNSDELQQAIALNMRVVLHDETQIAMLDTLSNSDQSSNQAKVAIKLDSGMHRLGFDVREAKATIERIKQHPKVDADIWLMSHFASADNTANDYTKQQLALFNQLASQYPYPQTTANSAGVLAWPNSHKDWIRPGIMLYGSCPIIGSAQEAYDLQTVMTLSAPITAIHKLRKGDTIGYSETWRCPRDMTVAVVGCGYADGYPRHAPSGTPVWLNGQKSQLLGRVSMDMIVIDLNLVKAKVGDTVELWGKHVSVDEVAKRADTISYELLCHAGNSCRQVIRGAE